MNFKNLLWAGVFLAAGLLLSGCGSPSLEKRGERMLIRTAWILNLNHDQKETLKKIQSDFFDKLKSQKQERQEIRQDMKTMILGDAIDSAKLDELAEKRKALNLELEKIITPELIEFHKTLTPVQKQKIVEWMDRIQERIWKDL